MYFEIVLLWNIPSDFSSLKSSPTPKHYGWSESMFKWKMRKFRVKKRKIQKHGLSVESFSRFHSQFRSMQNIFMRRWKIWKSQNFQPFELLFVAFPEDVLFIEKLISVKIFNILTPLTFHFHSALLSMNVQHWALCTLYFPRWLFNVVGEEKELMLNIPTPDDNQSRQCSYPALWRLLKSKADLILEIF